MTEARVPGFLLEASLGSGAFGEVYLAREEGGLRRRVALKLFRAGEPAYERELEMTGRVEALRAEAQKLQALGQVQNPALVGVATTISGSARLGVSPVVLLFALGLVLLIWVKAEGER